MPPWIIHPEQLKGYRLSPEDRCRLALLSNPERGACTLFVEIHDPRNRVPPHSHHHAAELYFVLRGSVIFHVGDQQIKAHGGDFVTVPEETIHELENPGEDRLYMLTVLSHDEGFADLLEHAIPTPLEPDDIEALRTL
ncbi:MAG: cupin domain-containing protein [Synechococcaceae cyanobacterium]|nr:cupin domain-containing protein [Synechococcaceae cyanobacterium]